MKNQFELLSILKKLLRWDQKPIWLSIKILWSDHAREYFSEPLSSFLALQGILQESSCPDAPQNNVAQGKNHLIETAHTMMIQYVPLRLWSDVDLVTCRLINRMPSSIHSKIPHSLLFLHREPYKLHLRALGHTCFARDVTLGWDTLSAKSLKSIFWVLSFSKRVLSRFT